MRLTRLLALVVLLPGSAVFAADVPIAGLKLIVIDKGGGGSKTVFVAKDVAISKGTSTDPTQIEATFEIAYDSASGAYLMPQGGKWTANKAKAAKYANKGAPTDGVVKVGLIKPGTLLKVVSRGLGDTPLDLSSPPSGDVYVAATIINGGERTRLCTRFSGCVHKEINGGYKLLCKGNSSGDPACNGTAADCPSAPAAPVGGSYDTCSTDIPSGEICALTCADGYSHSGTDPRCDDGVFVGAATCTPATCAPLTDPNLTTDCATGALGNQCTVQCAPGRHRSDGGVGTSVTATCTGTGPGAAAWTYPTFTCEEDPCTQPIFSAPVGGSYPSCEPPVPSGTVCPLVCADGYTHDGGVDPTCFLGFYFGQTSTCAPATCEPLVEPHIASNCGTATTGSTCTVQCEAGKERTDGGSGTSVTATCTGTGPGTSAWTHPTFTCGPIPCRVAPAPPEHGSYPSCTTPPIPSSTNCPLACDEGYINAGTPHITCYLGAYNGSATCVPDPSMLGTGGELCVAPAGPAALDHDGLNLITFLIVAIAAGQVVRRRRRPTLNH